MRPTLKHSTFKESDITLLSADPISVMQLSLLADEIRQKIESYRPEFTNIVRLHRNAGCRVHELFDAERWAATSNTMLQIQPQKGNALRLLPFADIGFTDAASFQSTHNDMSRLPERQYERIFSETIRNVGLWRLYEDGFARPSTHFFRHMKIKELYAQGFEKEYIAAWIGEKRVENLDYYLNSAYYT